MLLLCIPASGAAPQSPSSAYDPQHKGAYVAQHTYVSRSTYIPWNRPVFKDLQGGKCLPVQNILLVTKEILAE